MHFLTGGVASQTETTIPTLRNARKAERDGSSSHVEVVNKSWNGKTLTDLKESIKFQRTEEFAALDELSKINAEL